MRPVRLFQKLPTTLQPIDRRPRVMLPAQEFTDAHDSARQLRESELIWLSGAGLRLWD